MQNVRPTLITSIKQLFCLSTVAGNGMEHMNLIPSPAIPYHQRYFL